MNIILAFVWIIKKTCQAKNLLEYELSKKCNEKFWQNFDKTFEYFDDRNRSLDNYS